jgi:release factor glutamine methyltransferase
MKPTRQTGSRHTAAGRREAAADCGAPTIVEAVKLAASYLGQNGIEQSRLNAELLLAWVLECTRLDLYLRFDERLGDGAREEYREALKKRARHYPLQYITGEVEFYSLSFSVREGVCVPRPETELLIERVGELLPGGETVRFVEMGVGTAVIAATLAVRHPGWRGVAFDISPTAAWLARENAASLGVSDRLGICVADGFDAFDARRMFDLLVANPPYIPTDLIDGLQEEISRYEVRAALDGGPDGLRFYPALIEAGAALLRGGGLIAVEIGDGQASAVGEMLESAGYERIEMKRDYNGRERVMTAFRPHAGGEASDG